ncbi:MAG: glutamyl-tRNA reductase [Haloglomus sp.]
MNFNTVSGIRVTHETADVDDIETLSDRTRQEYPVELLERSDVSEVFALQTCHRAELYVVLNRGEEIGTEIMDPLTAGIETDAVVRMDHQQSLRHLLRVAAGLESMVLGEEEILGQIREAYQTHRELETLGPVLDTAVTKAIHVGQRARTETEINDGVHSITSAAVEFADAKAGLDGSSVLLVGAGNMGRMISRSLTGTGTAELVVANRTPQRAARLVADIESMTTDAVGLEAIPDLLGEVDVVITATGSEDFVIRPTHVDTEQDGVIIDIAQPRDVDPVVAARTGWALHDISALESITSETHERRRQAADRVETLVDTEYQRLREQYKQHRVEEVVSTIHSEADTVKTQHVETVLSKLEANGGVTAEQEAIISSFADALLSDLLAPPTQGLKHAAIHDDWATIRAAVQLFDPMFDASPPQVAEDANRVERSPSGMSVLEDD